MSDYDTYNAREKWAGGWSEKVYIERLPDGSDVYPPQGPSIEERRRRRWRWLVRWLPFRRFKTWQWRGDWKPLLSDEEIKMSHSPTGDRAYDERHPGEVEDCDLCSPTREQHVLPVADLIDHTEDEDCPCGPNVTFVSGGKVVTHNSLDGRETR